MAIIPNEAVRLIDALPDAAPIASGRRNVELMGPVATPPLSKAIAEKRPGVRTIASMIRT